MTQSLLSDVTYIMIYHEPETRDRRVMIKYRHQSWRGKEKGRPKTSPQWYIYTSYPQSFTELSLNIPLKRPKDVKGREDGRVGRRTGV